MSYDPAYAYEIRHIMADGLQRMYGDAGDRDPNVMYYITVYNEPIHQPAEPENVDVEGIVKGIYNLDEHQNFGGPKAQLLASGVGVPWAREARELLARDWGVDAAVWSVTSWNELRRDGLDAEEHNYLHPTEPRRTPYVSAKLAGREGPFVASSDFDRMLPDQIRQWVPGDYHVLGADGFGFSDTRRAARRWYHIDAESMVVRTLAALADKGQVDPSVVQQAIEKYGLFNYSIQGNDHAGGGVIVARPALLHRGAQRSSRTRPGIPTRGPRPRRLGQAMGSALPARRIRQTIDPCTFPTNREVLLRLSRLHPGLPGRGRRRRYYDRFLVILAGPDGHDRLRLHHACRPLDQALRHMLPQSVRRRGHGAFRVRRNSVGRRQAQGCWAGFERL